MADQHRHDGNGGVYNEGGDTVTYCSCGEEAHRVLGPNS